MGEIPIRLATLLGSRICHDLISPIGAINNGLELLNMDGTATGSPEMDLIAESVGNASARIRFYRIAFGSAGDQMVGHGETLSILRDLFDGSRMMIEWFPTDSHSKSTMQLVFLSILCLETAMPFGGEMSITEDNGKWVLRGEADRLNILPDNWAMLCDPQAIDSIQPAQVQFGILPIMAAGAGRQITSEITENTVKIAF